MSYWTRMCGKHALRIALGGMLSAVGVAAAGAAEYHGVAAADGFIMLVDKSSIYETGGYTRGWIVTINADPNEDQDPIESTLDEFDCGQHRWRALSQTSRSEDGEVIDSFDNSDLSWVNVEPSTIAENLQTAICSPSSMTDDPFPTDDLAAIRNAYLQTRK